MICIKDPKSDEVFGFVSRTLPFGSAAAVLAFNRVACLGWRILIEAGILCTNYFDDYPVMDFSGTSGTAVLMALLDFKCLLQSIGMLGKMMIDKQVYATNSRKIGHAGFNSRDYFYQTMIHLTVG